MVSRWPDTFEQKMLWSREFPVSNHESVTGSEKWRLVETQEAHRRKEEHRRIVLGGAQVAGKKIFCLQHRGNRDG
ncbi:hypothetical protein NDU88_006965 [Pleurodeles waltl]|uniref:Uncharacterized protein n=1 Tax=Pleurodeles waltl TaxID=8319 RepID=A0AAV7UN98_PLEWA|nr:hypothetical protein NDU88_006965 [Pleurodeles waltl]